ncbi:hypothetical protein QSJ19_00925 [Gordonia sp. ABSL11-1]|uniref:hypothetical protein n=1 Tax=Gordonia sp. ABSL11-1 TaxID=3053924 RepID=UPI002572FC7C|nr:hypothetical protein [Gordonia sp. ABSL11-1]MDL9944164.1 hypothetical protein [Gordonia sp. ABSL11-1]
MALTAKMYGLFLKSLANKEVDLDSDTLKVMLCTSSYTPNQDTHQYKSDVTNEITGTGYSAGGQTLTGVTVTYNAATNTLMLDANDPSWGSSTLTARYLVAYDDTPATAAAKPLICYWDFGQDEVSSSGNFTATISGSGLITITAA